MFSKGQNTYQAGYEAIIIITVAKAREMEAKSGPRRGTLYQLKGLQLTTCNVILQSMRVYHCTVTSCIYMM